MRFALGMLASALVLFLSAAFGLVGTWALVSATVGAVLGALLAVIAMEEGASSATLGASRCAVSDEGIVRPRFDPDRIRFAWICARVAVASFAIATIAAIDPTPGWLVVVGGYAFAVLMAAVAGLTALIELETRANELPEEAPTPAIVRPFALLPPAPPRLLLEPPRQVVHQATRTAV